MAFVCGWLLNLMTRAKELPQLQLILRRIIASVAGCLTYVVLYMTKSYITLYLESNIGEAVGPQRNDLGDGDWKGLCFAGKRFNRRSRGKSHLFFHCRRTEKAAPVYFIKPSRFFLWKHPSGISSWRMFSVRLGNIIVTFGFW